MKSETEVLVQIGEKLKQLRIKAGYTSYESFAIEYDISRMMYWKIEKGKTNITIKTLMKILNVHSISIEEFFKNEAHTGKTLKKREHGKESSRHLDKGKH